MKEILRLGLVLGVISTVSVGLLGTVNELTKPIVANQKEESQQLAMQAILTDANTFEKIDLKQEGVVTEVYKGIGKQNYVGAVAKITPEGYGGTIEALVGISPEGTVVGIEILSHIETPGLDANASQVSFKDQYKGKVAPLSVVKGNTGESEISAITGATITTRAITEGVNTAVEVIQTYQENWKTGEDQSEKAD